MTLLLGVGQRGDALGVRQIDIHAGVHLVCALTWLK